MPPLLAPPTSCVSSSRRLPREICTRIQASRQDRARVSCGVTSSTISGAHRSRRPGAVPISSRSTTAVSTARRSSTRSSMRSRRSRSASSSPRSSSTSTASRGAARCPREELQGRVPRRRRAARRADDAEQRPRREGASGPRGRRVLAPGPCGPAEDQHEPASGPREAPAEDVVENMRYTRSP